MYIRYRHWATDGVPAFKTTRGPTEYVFLDTEQGISDVRDREGIVFLLARPMNFELVYERYGVQFGTDGKEVEATQPVAGSAAEDEDQDPVALVRKPGRPKKR